VRIFPGQIGALVVAAASVLLLAIGHVAAAQVSAPVVQGRVADESGGVLPGAIITATSRETGAAATATADARGQYLVPLAAPGQYALAASLPGFRSVTIEIDVAAGAALTRDITLALAPLLTEVTVTRANQALATVPAAVTVVAADDVRSGQRRVSLQESLRGIPGVFVEDRVNLSESFGVRLSIRAPVRGVGIGVRGLQILQDDIPLTMSDGTTQPTNVDLGSTGAIEVMRGPSSVLYGNSAGGVITLRTEIPEGQPLVVEPDVQSGSDGYRREQVKLSGSNGPVGFVVNVSRMTTHGFREHSAADVRLANTVARVRLTPATEVRGVFNLFDMPFGESPSTLALADARDQPRSARPSVFELGLGESSRQGQGGLTIDHRFDGGSRLRVTGWGMWRGAWNPIPARIVSVQRSGGGIRVEYTGATVWRGLPIAWAGGLDAARQDDDSVDDENLGVGGGTRAREGARLVDQLERVRSIGPFAQVTATVRRRWTVTAGVRHDAFTFVADDRLRSDGDQSGRRAMGALSPSAGVTFAATPNAHLYGSVSTAFETPTVQELANRPSGEGGFNSDLGPQTLRSFDVGARGVIAAWRVRYDVAAYLSTLHDALVQHQRADEVQYFLNAGESSRRGVEALAQWTPLAAFTARLSYTGQRFRFVHFVTESADFSGKREPGAPPQQIAASVALRAAGLSSTWQWRWIDSYPVNDANTVSNWAAHVADLRIAFQPRWKRVDVRPFFGVDNVFDARFNGSIVPNAFGTRFFEPSPGRQIYAGLSLGIGR
jgi:iron complex outermembrane receptor protein